LSVALEIVRVSDDELVKLAKVGGSRSTEARIVKQLRKRRAKDYQAYAFRVGNHYFIGCAPDARTELEILARVDAQGD
jgi:hypothetical protein